MGVALGLRWEFLDEVLDRLGSEAVSDHPPLAPVTAFEVAPENYMRRGGYFPAMLRRVAEHFPILSHGLMLSLGSVDPLDGAYLAELRRFLDRFGVPFHSDHLCFSGLGGRVAHDLLPLPFTEAAVRHVVDRIRRVEDAIGRPFAIENITYYVAPGTPEMSEATFLNEVLDRSGARLLLDVNNVVVNAKNLGGDPGAFLGEMPLDRVVALHAAGHERQDDRFIDTHGADMEDRVLDLVSWVIERTGPLPVVLERDHQIPDLDGLLAEARRLQEAYDRGLARREARRDGRS